MSIQWPLSSEPTSAAGREGVISARKGGGVLYLWDGLSTFDVFREAGDDQVMALNFDPSVVVVVVNFDGTMDGRKDEGKRPAVPSSDLSGWSIDYGKKVVEHVIGIQYNKSFSVV